MKSHASVDLSLLICILSDAVSKCSALELDYRDVETLTSRVEHEGDCFVTIRLPALGSDFERSLDQGYIGPDAFQGFGKHLKAPSFLKGFFDLVFDRSTGRILDDPDICAIEGIRQICYAFKKMHMLCSSAKIVKAIKGFVEIESELSEELPPETLDYFVSVSDRLWGETFKGLNPWDFIPKHGPGATAEKISGNKKYQIKRWHDRLEAMFPLLGTGLPLGAYDSEELQNVTVVSWEKEQPVRVIFVPKTQKAPRVIAIEPVCMQYAQQAVSRELTRTIEMNSVAAGHVNFRDQSINQFLALISSRTKKMATLDLSSASDRVLNSVAIRMFDGNPELQDAIKACRSRKAKISLTGLTLSLEKFASMGSALCFPVEAMYFYTICVGALLRKWSLPVTDKAVSKMAELVYVYGDDIIVPVSCAEAVKTELEKYKLKVGADKSFWTGKFRESCGLDAYDGVEVTPTYVRQQRPFDRRRHAKNLISWVKTSNLFYKKGYWRAASYMKDVCESLLGPLPIVSDESGVLGFVSAQGVPKLTDQQVLIKGLRVRGEACALPIDLRLVGPVVSRQNLTSMPTNSTYQRAEVCSWVPCACYQEDFLEGHAALTKFFIRKSEGCGEIASLESVDPQHLLRSPRHGAVALQRRWTPVS